MVIINLVTDCNSCLLLAGQHPLPVEEIRGLATTFDAVVRAGDRRSLLEIDGRCPLLMRSPASDEIAHRADELLGAEDGEQR
jgi:hypothetical protein